MADEQDLLRMEVEEEDLQSKVKQCKEACKASWEEAWDIYEQKLEFQGTVYRELEGKYKVLEEENSNLKATHTKLEKRIEDLEQETDGLYEEINKMENLRKYESTLLDKTLEQLVDQPAVVKERDELKAALEKRGEELRLAKEEAKALQVKLDNVFKCIS